MSVVTITSGAIDMATAKTGQPARFVSFERGRLVTQLPDGTTYVFTGDFDFTSSGAPTGSITQIEVLAGGPTGTALHRMAGLTLDFAQAIALSAPGAQGNADPFALDRAAFAGNDSFTGGTGRDVILAGAGNDTLVLTAGGDDLRGEAGDDGFVVREQAVLTGASLSGGDGSDTLRLEAAGLSLTGTSLSGIDRLVQTAAGGGVTLTADQAAALAAFVGVAGSGEGFTIQMGARASLDLGRAGFIGDGLADAGDKITVNGGSATAALSITGSAIDDVITGGAGGDTLAGGAGNDLFIIAAAGQEMGDWYNGGAGTDTVRVDGASIGLAGGQLAGIERLVLTQAGALASLDAALLNGQSLAIEGTEAGRETILTALLSGRLDLSSLTFGAGFQRSGDHVQVNAVPATSGVEIVGSSIADWLLGGAENDTLSGGAGNDNLTGGAGADSLSGGAGDDEFFIAAAGHETGDRIDGGEGRDKLYLDASGIRLVAGQLTGIEQLTLRFASGDLWIDSSLLQQPSIGIIGAEAGLYNVRTSLSAGSLDLRQVGFGGSFLEAGGLITVDAAAATDSVQVLGTFIQDSITGGRFADTLSGGSGNDLLRGDPGREPGQVGNDGSRQLTATSQAYLATAGSSLVNGLGGTAGFGESQLVRNDDESSSSIDIRSIFGDGGLNFFGAQRQSLYVNTNGNITFTQPLSAFTPLPIGTNLDFPIIAPFWADVDIEGGGDATVTPGGTSTGSNSVYYDLDTANGVFTITWDDVGAYRAGRNPTNAFQLQLVDRGGGDFDIIFRYEAVNWSYGSASDGQHARAGFSSGTGISYEIPVSATAAILDIDSVAATPGTQGATDRVGVYIFNVRNGQVVASGAADSLDGGAGADTLEGGVAGDTLTGGDGNDTFHYATGDSYAASSDLITDFAVGDVIRVQDLVMTGAVTSGNGTGLIAGQVQVAAANGFTIVHLGVDQTGGADLVIRLTGEFTADRFTTANGVLGLTAPAAAPPPEPEPVSLGALAGVLLPASTEPFLLF